MMSWGLPLNTNMKTMHKFLSEAYLTQHKDAPKVQPRENHKPRINYERAWKDYREDGFWFEDVLEYIPIDQINVPEVWNSNRYEDNKKWLERTGALPPIKVSLHNGKYEIGDGIHRTNVARDAGYKYIPAIVTYKRTTEPPIEPDANMKEIMGLIIDAVEGGDFDLYDHDMYFGRTVTDVTEGVITVSFPIVDSNLGLYDDGVIGTLIIQVDEDEYKAFLYNENNDEQERVYLPNSFEWDNELNKLLEDAI